MSSTSARKVSSQSDRRATSIFKCGSFDKSPSVSHFPIFNLTIDKENQLPQIRLRSQFMQNNNEIRLYDDSNQHSQKRMIEFTGSDDLNKKYQFPVFRDRDLGIDSKFQKFLQESYDNDDDIDTKQSVLEYFVEVCKQDLLEGLKMNNEEWESINNNNFNGLHERMTKLCEELEKQSSKSKNSE